MFRRFTVPVIIAILLLAAALRIWGIGWGLPNARHYFSYHPDETVVLGAATRIDFLSGQLDPGFYNYGSLYIYLTAFAILLGSGWGLINIPSKDLLSPEHIAEFAKMYLAGRWVAVLLGIATVYLTYRLGSRAYGRRVGLLGALAMAVMPIHVMHSKFLAVDVPATFFVTLSLIFAMRILDGQRWKDYLLAGLFAGLAAATKYNAGLVIVGPIVAHFLADKSKPAGRILSGKLVSMLGITVGGFLVGTPGVFLNWDKFSHDFAYEVIHVRTGHGMVFAGTGSGYLFHYISSLWYGMGIPFLAWATAGFIYAVVKRRSADLVLFSFVLVYYGVIGAAQVRFARYIIPLTPVLALFGARFLVDALVSKDKTGNQRWRNAGWLSAAVGAFVLTLFFSISIDALCVHEDTRDIAADWIHSNVPYGSSIMFPTVPWFYTPPISPWFGLLDSHQRLEKAREMQSYRLVVGDTEWNADLLKKEKPEYVIVSEFETRDRARLKDPQYYAFENVLDRDYTETHTFNRDQIGSLYPSFGSNLPHDMSYISPSITIYKRGGVR